MPTFIAGLTESAFEDLYGREALGVARGLRHAAREVDDELSCERDDDGHCKNEHD